MRSFPFFGCNSNYKFRMNESRLILFLGKSKCNIYFIYLHHEQNIEGFISFPKALS
jgi:hypothetical protein